ncbi:hypothetical protein ABLG96_06825 [Nakamurella sp. A5-74]|uniref:Uncharacterized protein n=1 Tax=Nakamurella sp. A5-74 TaxID=3158264 RepID=A0AAU8DUX8_9ACTN
MNLLDAHRLLAQLGVPDLDAWLRDGWQRMETGPHWALEQDLVKLPPQRTEFPDEDTLARYLVHQRLWVTGPQVPTAPAPARPWSVVREDPDDGPLGGPGLRWSSWLVTGSTCAAADPEVLLVRDVSSWWDHLLAGAAVIRTIALATGEQLEARVDNDRFALGRGPTPELGRRPLPPTPLPRWARGVVPDARSANPHQDLSVVVRPVRPPTGDSEARFIVVLQQNIRRPTDGVLLQIWSAGAR